MYENNLSTNRPYDCEINFKIDSSLCYGLIFQLNKKELIALMKYNNEILAKGFIRKSKSPAGALIFFVLKKNREL